MVYHLKPTGLLMFTVDFAKKTAVRLVIIILVSFVLTILLTISGNLIWFLPHDWYMYALLDLYGSSGAEDAVDFAFLVNFLTMLIFVSAIVFLLSLIKLRN